LKTFFLLNHTGPNINSSILIADFYAKRYVALKGSKITNEGFCFGLDFSSDYESVLKNFVENENFVLNNFFFMGHKTKKGAFMVVAEISI